MRTSRLFRLLDAELLDAQDDIRDLEGVLKVRCDTREITNYVYRENNALMEQEIHSIERIRKIIAKTAMNEDMTFSEFADLVLGITREQVEHQAVPGAVESIIMRRIHRISACVAANDEAIPSSAGSG